MRLLGLFGPPNINKLAAKKNVKGLVKAPGYEKDEEVRQSAAETRRWMNKTHAVKPLIAAMRIRIWGCAILPRKPTLQREYEL